MAMSDTKKNNQCLPVFFSTCSILFEFCAANILGISKVEKRKYLVTGKWSLFLQLLCVQPL